MQENQARRKRKGFGYYLYAFVTLTLLIAIILLSAILLTHVQEIEVTGNEYSTENEILNVIWEDPKTSNSLYALWKFKSGSYDKPAYLENMDIRLVLPWKIQLNVTEKQIVGCGVADEKYVYFDKEGLVLEKSSELLEGISIIEGIECNNVELYETIPIENEKVFSYIVNLTEELERRELVADRILWEEDGMKAYFEGVCVQFGKSGFEEKVLQLTAIIKELDGKEGILHLEHYSKTSNSISFEPKKDKKE